MDFDVAIIGGGPSGSTTACFLKKYAPHLRVAVLERECFPRDHIGESLLPPINEILAEMGIWDSVEAAGFPIKIGATYRWGRCPELWDINFVDRNQIRNEARPAKLQGPRTATAFQVDRSAYDKILLDHAQSLGCTVLQPGKVNRVVQTGDRVDYLEVADGYRVESRHYVDASGSSGILRRSLGVECSYPTSLRNIAIWDYWQNAEWAVEIGVGGTRIQVLTLGYGWLWFIPLGPTRTSIGIVLPAEYYKNCGMTIAELYEKAIAEESIVAGLTKRATREGKLETTRDWSFLAARHAGENWFLVGECAGFADPILSAGVTMAQTAARQAAFTILEVDRPGADAPWLKEEFTARQSQRIRTHIKFADYWYTANSQFTQLREFTQALADDVGIDLSPEGAWAWLSQGGFIDEDLGYGAGGFPLRSVRMMSDMLVGGEAASPLDCFNVFSLDLGGASVKRTAVYANGRVTAMRAYCRDGKVLPDNGPFVLTVDVLRTTTDFATFIERVQAALASGFSDPATRSYWYGNVLQVLEALVSDGWVKASLDPTKPRVRMSHGNRAIAWNTDNPKQFR